MEKQPRQPDPSLQGKTFFFILALFAVLAFSSGFLIAKGKPLIEKATLWLNPPKPATASIETAIKRGPELKSSIPPLKLTRALANPATTFPDAQFSLSQTFASTDFCALLEKALPEFNLSWRDSPFIEGATECTGVIEAPKTAEDAIHNSLFSQVRRDAKGAATVVRLKLVYLPDLGEPEFKSQFDSAARALVTDLFANDRDEILDKITSLTPFEMRRQSIDIKLIKETLFAGSYNLMVETKCSNFDCPTTSRYYRLSQVKDPPTATAQQE